MPPFGRERGKPQLADFHADFHGSTSQVCNFNCPPGVGTTPQTVQSVAALNGQYRVIRQTMSGSRVRGGAGLGAYSRSRERRKASSDNQDKELPKGRNEAMHLASRLTPTLIAFAVLFCISVPVFAHLEGWSFIESFYFGERQMAGERAHVMPLPGATSGTQRRCPPRIPIAAAAAAAAATATLSTFILTTTTTNTPLAVAQSVTTTGYGDYTPTHQVSRGVAIALVVLGLIITTVWVAQIHSSSSEMGRAVVRRRLKEKGVVARNGLEIEEITQVPYPSSHSAPLFLTNTPHP